MTKELSVLEIRTILGLSQEDMAKQLGLDRSSISHFENGRSVSGPVKILLSGLEKRALRKREKAKA